MGKANKMMVFWVNNIHIWCGERLNVTELIHHLCFIISIVSSRKMMRGKTGLNFLEALTIYLAKTMGQVHHKKSSTIESKIISMLRFDFDLKLNLKKIEASSPYYLAFE